MTALAALDHVRLTPAAALDFPDIGTRDGVVLRIETGWAVVKLRGANDERRLPVACWERLTSLEPLVSAEDATCA